MLSKGESDVSLLFPSLQNHRPAVRAREGSPPGPWKAVITVWAVALQRMVRSQTLLLGLLALGREQKQVPANLAEVRTVPLSLPAPLFTSRNAHSSLQGLGLGQTHAGSLSRAQGGLALKDSRLGRRLHVVDSWPCDLFVWESEARRHRPCSLEMQPVPGFQSFAACLQPRLWKFRLL